MSTPTIASRSGTAPTFQHASPVAGKVPQAHTRVSTARTGVATFFGLLVDEMPPGLILNLGSGSTGGEDASHILVNVDHALPRGARPPGLVVVADAHHLPFAPASFAGAIAKDVLEHVEDPIGVLTELARTCVDEGRLVVAVPRAIPRAVWDDPTHIRGFTANALRTALKLSGWTVAAPIRRIGGFPGAGRLGLSRHLEMMMRVPGLGHWFGRNWIVRATLASTGPRS